MANSNTTYVKKSGKGINTAKCCEPEGDFVLLEHEHTHSQIIDNGDCTYLHISGNGNKTLIDADPNFSLIDNCDGILTFAWKDHDPVVVDICKIVGDNCNATLTVNPDGTLTFTDNTGTTTTTVPLPNSQFIDNGDGTLTHIAGDGTVTVVDLCGLVAGNCTDQLIDNLDGSFTHVAIDGTVTGIPAPPLSSLINNGNGTYTHFDGAGNSTLIDINELDKDVSSVTLAGSVITFTSEDGTTIDIDVCGVVATYCNASLIENIDGSWTFTDNAGVSTTSTIPTGSILTDNGNGTATHVSVDGTITTLDVCQMMIDGGCTNTDSLVDNGNGTFTHTATDGTVTTISVNGRPASDMVDNGDGSFTHTNGDGVITLVDICQSVAANCNATMVGNPDGSYTFTDNAGGSIVIAAGGIVMTATAAFVSTNNVTVGIGESYIQFGNGQTWASSGHGVLLAATAAFVATNGFPVSIGDTYILFPDGSTWATNLGGGTVLAATAPLVTTNGIAIGIGEFYVLFDDTTTWGPDGTGTVATATVAFVTTNGVSVGIGGNYVEFTDGTTWASDGGANVLVAAAPFVTTNGISIAIGESYIQFASGDTWASDGGTVAVATVAFVTTNGVPVGIGANYIDFADGTTWAASAGSLLVNDGALGSSRALAPATDILWTDEQGDIVYNDPITGLAYYDTETNIGTPVRKGIDGDLRGAPASDSGIVSIESLGNPATVDTFTLSPTDTPDASANNLTNVATLFHTNNSERGQSIDVRFKTQQRYEVAPSVVNNSMELQTSNDFWGMFCLVMAIRVNAAPVQPAIVLDAVEIAESPGRGGYRRVPIVLSADLDLNSWLLTRTGGSLTIGVEIDGDGRLLPGNTVEVDFWGTKQFITADGGQQFIDPANIQQQNNHSFTCINGILTYSSASR